MRTIDQVLDRAQLVQNVRSDYKLGLCLGIGQSSISNYRLGKTLPDGKVCIKLAAAMGEDAGVLVAEIEAQRTNDLPTKALWISIAKRLQSGFSALKMLLLLATISIALSATPALSATYCAALLSRVSSLYIVEFLKVIKAFFTRKIVKFCKVVF